jgi:hypothetical protein
MAKDIILYILVTALAVIPILKEILWKNSSSRFYVWIIVLISVGTIWLGIDKIYRDDKNNQTIRNKFIKLEKSSQKDSTNMAEFLVRLKDQFKIVRDSINNQPKSTTIINNINDAKEVNIDQRGK